MTDDYPQIRPVRSASFGFGIPIYSRLPWVKGPLWRLVADWVFEVPGYGAFRIPAGYEFDKASIPPFLWGPPFNYLPDGPCELPALQHDFLCDLWSGGSDWLRAQLIILPEAPPAPVIHEMFHRWLHENNERPSKANAMGAAVKRFGPGGTWRASTIFRELCEAAAPYFEPSGARPTAKGSPRGTAGEPDQ
ncbi:MAG TPA: DUF1353 domain-containing protein [Prosthecobacter sp.]|nr:DUF1353 domain-containing protein [Prosthecobacter sp.]